VYAKGSLVSEPDNNVPGPARADLTRLQDEVRDQGYALAKWGRMLNALIALLEAQGVLTKQDIMLKVYERLRGSGALERAADGPSLIPTGPEER